MIEGLKRFLLGNLVLFIAVIIILPPVGVLIFGLLFVPILILVGFAWLIQLARMIFVRE